jgi:hypothetical protein
MASGGTGRARLLSPVLLLTLALCLSAASAFRGATGPPARAVAGLTLVLRARVAQRALQRTAEVSVAARFRRVADAFACAGAATLCPGGVATKTNATAAAAPRKTGAQKDAELGAAAEALAKKYTARAARLEKARHSPTCMRAAHTTMQVQSLEGPSAATTHKLKKYRHKLKQIGAERAAGWHDKRAQQHPGSRARRQAAQAAQEARRAAQAASRCQGRQAEGGAER